MAHQMLKPYSFLLYFLAFIGFFFIGVSYAGFVDAGKNQGLAGGAIVLGYGVIGAAIGFIASLLVASKTNRKIIFKTNAILSLSIVAFWAYYHLKYLEKQKNKALEKQKFEKPKTPTKSIDKDKETAMLLDFEKKSNKSYSQQESSMGLGMFTPNFYKNPVLYFYGNVNLEKGVMEHTPTDSITFKSIETGGFEITTAPPWLVPEHLKLDYDMLYFKVQTITHDFLEITVNTINNQTSYVDRHAGKLQYWPEFLLSVHSVEFPNPEKEHIYVKPLDYAGKVITPYSFMKPIRIKNDWMYVELQNDGFQPVSKGWIKWQTNGKLLIRYSLLS